VSILSRIKYCCLLLVAIYFCGCKNSFVNQKDTFYINQATGIESLDPAFSKALFMMWQCNQLYNRLVENDDKLNIKPSLAKSWQVSSDGKKYTFQLRTDIFFHDNEAFQNGNGRKMLASDVAYSLNRIIDAKVASPGAWIFNGKVDSLNPFVALNDSVFELNLLAPFNPILNILSMQYCSIVPKEVAEKWGKDFRSHPCGTGPFAFEHWDEGNALVFKKNPNYWEFDSTGQRLPYLSYIKTNFIDSKAAEFLMFMQGRLDFMNGLDASFKDQVTTKQGVLKDEYKTKIQLKKSPYLNIEYLGILTDSSNSSANKLLLNKEVRQAINAGFDKAKLVTYVRNSVGKPGNSGMIPFSLPGFDTVQQKQKLYDPVSAKLLLANYDLSEPITIFCPDMYEDRCSFVVGALEDLGVKAKVEVIQQSILREQISQSRIGIFWATWIADYADAECYLTMFYGKNTAPPNYTRYKNPIYDALYEKSLLSTNEQEKVALYQKMNVILQQDVPAIPLFYDEVLHFLQKNISGWETSPLNLISLKRVKKN
jgi:oligopeptide transport system substrate-binding protein